MTDPATNVYKIKYSLTGETGEFLLDEANKMKETDPTLGFCDALGLVSVVRPPSGGVSMNLSLHDLTHTELLTLMVAVGEKIENVTPEAQAVIKRFIADIRAVAIGKGGGQ